MGDALVAACDDVVRRRGGVRVARMADPDNRVELTDLDVISRYSLAVRAATADRNELIATLRADLEWLQGGRPRRTSATSTPARSAPEPEPESEPEPEAA